MSAQAGPQVSAIGRLLCRCYDGVRKVITSSLPFSFVDLDIKDDRHKVWISSRTRLMSDKLLLEQSRQCERQTGELHKCGLWDSGFQTLIFIKAEMLIPFNSKVRPICYIFATLNNSCMCSATRYNSRQLGICVHRKAAFSHSPTPVLSTTQK